jgi:DNA-binding MarR family transcriptional regulator
MSDTRLRLDRFVPYRLSYTSNIVSDSIARTYQALFGLKIPEWRIMAVVAENPDGLTQQDIVSRTGMDKVTVSRAAIALADRGLVERSRNDRDGRSRLLGLTADGRALYAAIAPKALALEDAILKDFTAAERETLMRLLARIDAATRSLSPD